MGKLARLGVFCLMGLAICLARLIEVEYQPERLSINAPPTAASAEREPQVEAEAKATVRAVVLSGSVKATTQANVTRVSGRQYTVRSGDTLDRISKKVYGTRRHWRTILKANRKVIPRDPRAMRAGVVLEIPCLDSSQSTGPN